MSKGRKVKAAVSYEVGKTLVIEEVILEAPRKDEVTIRYSATSISSQRYSHDQG